MRPVHIAFCGDPAYFQPMAVAAQSTVETAHDPRSLHFWILTSDDPAGSLDVVRHVVECAGARCSFLNAGAITPLLAGAPTRGHISAAAYYRLFLPELLPADVERVLYLDADVLVRHPIEDLWDTDLGGYTLGAVMKPRAAEYQELGLAAETDYFNSGVLLIDPARWRTRRVREAALEFALRNPGCRHGHDQPALNRVFAGRWRRLDPRWNQQFKFFVHTAGYLRVSRAELRRIRRDPFIVHYTTASKPWVALNDHPLRHCYFEVLDRTPLAGWRPARAPLRARLRALAVRQVPHWLRPAVLRNVFRPPYRAFKDRLWSIGHRPADGALHR